jgi:CheY-like chemotaxis protein
MPGKPVILCVDDKPSVLEGQKMLLEGCGYRVLTATNGEEAVQAFVSNSIDLVLLDYHMPSMNGEAAARHMRAAKPDVPIALVSGDDCLPPSALRAVDCCIPKSEPIARFLEKVTYLLSPRFLFQPSDALMTQMGVGQHKDR